MQNMTFGADGGLTAACKDKHPTQPHLCFMSPHMQEFIKVRSGFLLLCSC